MEWVAISFSTFLFFIVSIFKKIRDIKGTFHAKMGTIKGRNGTDLTEAEDIKKKWQEYTEKLYKKDHFIRFAQIHESTLIIYFIILFICLH